MSVLGLGDVCFISIRNSFLVSHLSQTDFVSRSVKLCELISETFLVSQLDFVGLSFRLCQLGQIYFVS